MNKVNSLWQDEVESVYDELLAHDIDADEAVQKLVNFGVDFWEARGCVCDVYWEHHHATPKAFRS